MSSNFETMAIANQTAIASARLPKIPRPASRAAGLIGMIDSARNAKAPIVGIPIPGERPFCITREMLRESLRDMRITEASIQHPLPGNGAKPYLLVFAETDNGIKGSRKYLPLDKPPYQIAETLSKWAESQRNKIAQPKLKGKAAKLATAIRKLQKERHSLWTTPKRKEQEPVGESGCDATVGKWFGQAQRYERESWMRWRGEKPKRQALAKIWAKYLAVKRGWNAKPDTSMYEDLDELFGTRVMRISEMNTRQRDAAGHNSDDKLRYYLQHPELFHLSSGPCCRDDFDISKTAANESQWRRERARDIALAKELDVQIEDLQAQLLNETTGGVQ